MKLQEKVEEILRARDTTFGISIKNLQTNEEVNINEDQLFQMASVFKIPILLTLFDQVYAGKIDLTKRIKITKKDYVPGSGVIQEMDPGIEVTVKDLATLMIIVSDNLATDKIYHMLGPEAIEKKMREIGLDNIKIKHSCWELLSLTVGMEPKAYTDERFAELHKRLYSDEKFGDDYVLRVDKENNLCTPKEMTSLLEMIANGEFVSEECSERILDIMFRQQLNQRIPGRLPFGVKVANKTGTIASAVNDAGIVYLPDNKGAFVISVFSQGNEEVYSGAETIAQISKAAFDYFLRV